jgi:hypothetical protein
MTRDRLRDAPGASAGAPKKRWLWQIAPWFGSAVIVVLVLIGTLVYAFQHQFYPKVPAPHFSAPQSIEEAQRQDLFRWYQQRCACQGKWPRQGDNRRATGR